MMMFLTILLLMFSIFLLIIIAFSVSKDIEKYIKNYASHMLKTQGIYDESLDIYLSNRLDNIMKLGIIGWPMYVLFLIGTIFGTKIYNLKVGDNYEDRIASWFL